MTKARKTLRRLLLAVGAIALVAVVLLLLVPRLVPGDLIADQVILQTEQATGARLTLDKAEVAWRGGWSVVLRQGNLQGTGKDLAVATGSPNDLESYAVRFEELSLSPALLPLLRRKVEIKSVSLEGRHFQIVGKDEVTRAVDFRVRITDLHLDLDGLEPLATPAANRGPQAPGTLIPSDLSFALAASVDTLFLQGVPYTGIDLAGGFSRKVLAVNQLSGRRATGEVTGQLNLDFATEPWGRLEFEAEVANAPAAALLEPWIPELGNRLDCALSADMVGRCDLRDPDTQSRTLDIAGTVTGSRGVLRAGIWLDEVKRYLGDRQDLQDIAFESLDHDFRLVQGRYLIKSLTLDGGETTCRAQGWIDLEGNLNLALDVKLPAGFTPDLGNYSFLAASLRDQEGRINLPLTLSGPSSRPDVGVDLGRSRTP